MSASPRPESNWTRRQDAPEAPSAGGRRRESLMVGSTLSQAIDRKCRLGDRSGPPRPLRSGGWGPGSPSGDRHADRSRFSDIHGNQLALEHVLADARRVGVDRVACLGDVATLGPRPRGRPANPARPRLPRHPGQPRRVPPRPVAGPPLLECQGHRRRRGLVPRAALGRRPRVHPHLRTRRLTSRWRALAGSFTSFMGPPSPTSRTCSRRPTKRSSNACSRGAARTSWRAATRTSRCSASTAARGSSTPGAWACPSAATSPARAPIHAPYAEYAIVDDRGEAPSVELHRVPLDRAKAAGARRGRGRSRPSSSATNTCCSTRDGHARLRMTPSCTVLATSRPARSKNRPLTDPRVRRPRSGSRRRRGATRRPGRAGATTRRGRCWPPASRGS